MTEIQTFKRAEQPRQASPELLAALRRILERDPSMAVPARDWQSEERLTTEEQMVLLIDLMASVDENAHRRGLSEGRAS